VFRDTLSVTIADPLESGEEDRFVTIGRSGRNRTLVVAHLRRAANCSDGCPRSAGILPAVSGASRSRRTWARCPRHSGRDARATPAFRS